MSYMGASLSQGLVFRMGHDPPPPRAGTPRVVLLYITVRSESFDFIYSCTLISPEELRTDFRGLISCIHKLGRLVAVPYLSKVGSILANPRIWRSLKDELVQKYWQGEVLCCDNPVG